MWCKLRVPLGHLRHLVPHPDLHTVKIDPALHQTRRTGMSVGVDEAPVVHPLEMIAKPVPKVSRRVQLRRGLTMHPPVVRCALRIVLSDALALLS